MDNIKDRRSHRERLLGGHIWNSIAFLYIWVFVACGSSGHAASVVFSDAGNKTVYVELADTEQKRTRGLMFRQSLKKDWGMWFVFPAEKELVFWMKNVSFSIDIIFIDSRFFIRRIWKSVPPCMYGRCPTYSSDGPAMYALEVESGFCDKFGITENQKVMYRP